VTDALLRRVRPRVALGPLQKRDLEAARDLCARNPIAFVLPAMHIERALNDTPPAAGRLWAVHRRDGRPRTLVGIVWHGVNVVPAVPDPAPGVLVGLADAMASRIAKPSALVGEADVVLDLWGRLESAWGPARAVRDEQWLMALDEPPRFPPPWPPGDAGYSALRLDAVHRAVPDDFDLVLPAAVHMFRGEVGYDPTEHGRGVYEDRLRRLIRGGRSFVQFGDVGGTRRVVFKAEVGVIGGGVAEIQGVWVEPLLRGRGLARAGLAAVCEAIQADTAPTVSLYVNSFNRAAIAVYEAVGFRRVGTFATVMM
jgi:predicted GNAT family acetyltransferase